MCNDYPIQSPTELSKAFFPTQEQAENYFQSFIEEMNRMEIKITKADIKKVERSIDPYGDLGYSLIEVIKEYSLLTQ